MTGSLEIRYLSTAKRDLEDIFDYIMKDRPPAARSFFEAIDRSISNLSSNPEIGVIPRDERLEKLGYRILIFEKYLGFYVVKPEFIQIRRIIHGARQYAFLL